MPESALETWERHMEELTASTSDILGTEWNRAA